jgi:ribosome biogenesis GTPase
MQLIDLGWNSFFDKEFEPFKERNLSPARIARENRQSYLIFGEEGNLIGEVSGKFRHNAESKGKFPAVGDWVAVETRSDEGKATIHSILPRKSAFLRKVAGQTTEEQVIAANIDLVFIVCGLDGNFNLRRIERFLSLTWESGAMPVILLNKADLCPNIEECRAQVESIAIGVAIYGISAVRKEGLDVLNTYILPGKTAAFLGSSGVGKSTIINSLLGEEYFKVIDVSELGSRGRHTTTHRELVLLPGGGMVIDTPGMRELQVWGDEEGLRQAFDDIEELAVNCRFRDCGHRNEPGCAVQSAISDGRLDPDRLRSYMKLQKELRYLAARQAMKASAIEKDRWKKISTLCKNRKRKGQMPY